ncbi:MAG: methionyl-tRNA formyltransferase [Prevotella sp.]|nr:methionyl-tRNA formyltransferase [Prevotella sp.]
MNKEDLRIVFMGTPEFAVETLKSLVEGGYNVVAVVTQPDKPVGRHGSVLRAPAVKEYALSKGLPVLQPEKMKDEAFLSELRAYKADLQVVVAFRMLPEVVWAMPRFGTFNVHAALLPLYRGAAPINWAIINGETKTGVTTFFLDHDIDTGRIIMQKEFPIPDNADVEYVYDGLMKLGAGIAIETIEKILAGDGKVESMPQVVSTECELPHAPKIFKETCQINWNQPAKRIYDFVRGLSPVPAAWTMLHEESGETGVMMKVYQTAKTGKPVGTALPGTIQKAQNCMLVATADEWIELKSIQLAGKKRMEVRDFLNGFHNIEIYSFAAV